MEFHHLGIVCNDIEKEIAVLKELFTVQNNSGIVFDREQNASVCFLKTKERPDIELIAGDKVRGLLKKGITYYHLCYEVENIESEVERLVAIGGILISPPKKAILFSMRRVSFVFLPIGIIELLEKEI